MYTYVYVCGNGMDLFFCLLVCLSRYLLWGAFFVSVCVYIYIRFFRKIAKFGRIMICFATLIISWVNYESYSYHHEYVSRARHIFLFWHVCHYECDRFVGDCLSFCLFFATYFMLCVFFLLHSLPYRDLEHFDLSKLSKWILHSYLGSESYHYNNSLTFYWT